jgi:hypothetical protein
MLGPDILDTRDVQQRIDELTETEEEYQELFDAYFPTMSAAEAAQKACDESGLDYDDRIELQDLRELRDELEGYCDWTGGEALIHEDYFVQYTEQLAEDIGAIDPLATWPLNRIDWDAAAADLKADYTKSGDYYVRMS